MMTAMPRTASGKNRFSFHLTVKNYVVIEEYSTCPSVSQLVAAEYAKRALNSEWEQVKEALVVHFRAAKYPDFGLNFSLLFYELQLRISSNLYIIIIIN